MLDDLIDMHWTDHIPSSIYIYKQQDNSSMDSINFGR